MATRRIGKLEDFASDTVGDGGSPNIYFVSAEGNQVLVTLDVVVAYQYWQALSRGRRIETKLEDRRVGVVASVEPAEDGGSRLISYDDVDLLPDAAKKQLKAAGLR